MNTIFTGSNYGIERLAQDGRTNFKARSKSYKWIQQIRTTTLQLQFNHENNHKKGAKPLKHFTVLIVEIQKDKASASDRSWFHRNKSRSIFNTIIGTQQLEANELKKGKKMRQNERELDRRNPRRISLLLWRLGFQNNGFVYIERKRGDSIS